MVIKKLNNVLNMAFKNAGFACDCSVVESNRPELCDYQCDNAFKLAKEFKTAPIKIANAVVEELKKWTIFLTILNTMSFEVPRRMITEIPLPCRSFTGIS